MKSLVFLSIFFPLIVFAKSEDYSTLSEDKKCFVKRYKNKEFFGEDSKKFYRLRIWATPHHKNERYSIFKYNGQIYVTLTSCLNPVDVSTDDFENLIDSAPTDFDKEVSKISNNGYVSDELRFEENKYFLEIDGGSVSFNDKKQIFPYDKLDGTVNGDVFDFKTPQKTTYKGGGSFSIGGGWKIGDGTFFALRFKNYTGSKKEIVPVTVNGTDAEAEFKYKDKFSSLLIGTKFIFWDAYRFKPVLSIFAGANRISSTFESDTKLELESVGVSGMGELGFEYLFTSNIGISVMGGYEYLGARKFRLKKKDETLNEGFTSKMSYSNTFINLGLRIYFR